MTLPANAGHVKATAVSANEVNASDVYPSNVNASHLNVSDRSKSIENIRLRIICEPMLHIRQV